MSLKYPSLIPVPMPILTPRLLIRPPEAGDGPAFHSVINASFEHIARYLPWPQLHGSLDDSENFVRQQQAQFILRTNLTLALFDRHTHDLLGGSGLHPIDWNLAKFEIGYWIRQDAEGQGYIKEAVNAITRYAFLQMRANRVEIRAETENVRSKAVAERLGFVQDACLRHDRFKINSQILTDTHIYARLDASGLPELDTSW